MRAASAYAELLRLGPPVLTTREAAARLRLPHYAASWHLHQLARDGMVVKIRRGLWALTGEVDPYGLPEYLTAPYPSYISTWTALYRHGIIDQIPREIYVVSLDRSKKIETSIGTFVIQQISPSLFGGFESRNGVRVATPEKGLFDVVYLAGVRGERFVRLPELELPARFADKEVRRWVKRIRSKRLRTLVSRQLEKILARADHE